MLKEHVRSVLRRGLRTEFDSVNQLKDTVNQLQHAAARLEDELALLRFKGSSTAPCLSETWSNRGLGSAFLAEEVFVLGSGESLHHLTDKERQYIGKSQTVAMNRYLLFWDLIGIWPKFVFLADSLGVGKRVFLELSRVVLGENKPKPTFLLEEYFQDFMHPNIPVVFFKRDDVQGSRLAWARCLSDPMFFHRGSLTSLINLLCVLRIAPVLKLLGVDLGPGRSFYHEQQKERYRDLVNPWDEKAFQLGMHATVAHVNGWNSSMLDHWHELDAAVKNVGVKLYCCNEKSLLVRNQLCEYQPVYG
jgi:hypothetical protein